MATVDADYTPTPRDYAQAIRAFMWADRSYRFSIIFFSFFFLFVFLFISPLLVSGGLDADALPAFVLGLLFPGFLLAVFLLTPWLTARKARRDERMLARSQFRFDETDMHCETRFSQTRFDWGTLHRTIETPEHFLLVYSSNKRMFHIIAKRGFASPEELDAFRELVKRRIPKYDDRTRPAALWLKLLAGGLVFAFLLLSAVLIVTSIQNRGEWKRVGVVKIESGKLLVSDPSYLPQVDDGIMVSVDDAQAGTHPVEVFIEKDHEWGERPWRARVLFVEGANGERRQLGEAPVDSGTLAFIDPVYLRSEWVEVGPLREGCVYGSDRDRIAELLTAEGYRIGDDDWCLPITEPVSEAEETRLGNLIDARELKGGLSITTGSSLDRLWDAMAPTDYQYGALPFADDNPGFLMAFESGAGDGTYPVYGLYRQNELVGVEVDMR